MIKPFLKTTTALVMMASLTLPAVAQGLDGMTPDDIFDGARDGSLDVGFETDGLSRDQVAAELARLQALCEAGETSEGVNCARIAELPDAASLMAGSGEDGAAEEAQATGSQEQDSQELSAQGNATADVAVPEDPEAPADEAETTEAEGEEAPAEAGAQDAPLEAPSTEAQSDEAESAPAETSEPAEESVESEDTDELRDALEEAEAQDAPAAAPDTEAQASETDADGQQRDAAEDAQAQQGADDTPAAEAEAADNDVPAAETEGADELRDALEEAEAQEVPEDAAPEADAENPEQADAQQETQTVNAEEPSLQAEPEEVSDQEQADAAARLSQQLGAAAAALGLEEAGEPEVVEEEVSDADVRSSDEDFSTQIGATRAQDSDAADERDGDRAEDDDDDNRDEMIRRLGTAAVAGLGAVALSKFLSNDAKVVENTGDRIVVEENGQYRVLRNDDVLLRRPGSDVTTYRYDDGSTRTVVEYQDGNAVETVKAADGRVLRRIRTLPDGEQIVLFDDTQAEQQVVVSDLPQTQDTARRMNIREVGEAELAAALAAESGADVGRTFSLNQIRNIDTVRHLVPEISVDSINFETGSAAIRPQEAQALAALGNAMKRVIADNPREVFLIEGHTDATGGWGYNLALSDRRAESVALALTEYFDVPPENMVLQGYGESDLAVETQTSERANRRAAVRRITPLLQGS